MASAGRILIMPKGAYDASATYEMLDMVSHNGTTWLAKKTVSNVEPSNANSEYWYGMFAFDPAELDTRKADGGSIQITANPEGKWYIDYTFEMQNANTIKLFANVVGMDSLFVTGISITDYKNDRVTARFFLNDSVDYDVTLAVGYLY